MLTRLQVPKQYLSSGTVVEDVNTGCRGCATGAGGNRNIFGNKYGQYLAAIQASMPQHTVSASQMTMTLFVSLQ